MVILHIINGLNNGGAEKTLLKLVSADYKNEHLVFVLTSRNDFYSSYFPPSVHLVFGCGSLIARLLQARKLVKMYKPNIIQGWMYHSNLFSSILRIVTRNNFSVYWNVRNYSLNGLKFQTKIIIIISGLISFIFRFKCIYPSFAAKRYHELFLFRNSFVIPNGFDLSNVFTSRRQSSNIFNLLMVARWDIQKDHDTLFKALSLIHEFDWELTLVGQGINENNYLLKSALDIYGLDQKVRMLGITDDIESVYLNNDVLLLTSTSESFPNVVVEAISNNLMVIATDVGDVRLILSSEDWLFAVKDHLNLAKLIRNAHDLWMNKVLWNNEVQFSRNRIVDRFSMGKMVDNYNFIWTNSKS